MKNYLEMLKEVREKLPDVVSVRERFEIPKVMGHIQGNRTIISNFIQIASYLSRNVDHLLKYVLKELAAPGEIKKSSSLIIGTKISATRINEKVRKYADEFVLCRDCGKPDTKLVRKDKILFLECLACGANNVVKSKI